MKRISAAASLVLLVLTLTSLTRGADEPGQPTARERLKARIAEDAKKTPAKTPASAGTSPASATASSQNPSPASADGTEPPSAIPSTTAGTATKSAAAAGKDPATKSNEAAAKSAPTVLPKMEVKKGRITVLDHERALQDIEIAREKKNLEVSEVDRALNDSKIARPLAIFGGDSTQFRQGVASERVQLMEAEKDLIEAIAFAKTKEEKAALQKQLNELKAMRRQLDKSMR